MQRLLLFFFLTGLAVCALAQEAPVSSTDAHGANLLTDTAPWEAPILTEVVVVAYAVPLVEMDICRAGFRPIVCLSDDAEKNTGKLATTREVFVTGTVTTIAGESLIGANILWDGYKGTLSDLDGNYYLTVPAGTEVTVSFLGFQETKVKVSKESEQLIDVVLTEGINLPELVITGQKVTTRTITISDIFSTTCYSYNDTIPVYPKVQREAEVDSQPLNYLQSATVYPNPFAGELSVEFLTETTQNVTVTLTDVSGRLVGQWSPQRVFAPQQTLHLRPRPGTLLPGIYFLRLTDETGRREVRKVIHASTLD